MNKEGMSKEALEMRREYQRKWRKEHPDKVKQHMRTYWEKKALSSTGNKSN